MPYTAAQRRAKQDAGFCARCLAVPSAPGRTRCEKCAAINVIEVTAWQKKRASQGLCCCGKPLTEDSRVRCPDCQAARRQLRLDRMAAGVCIECSNGPLVTKQYCLDHWFKQMAATHKVCNKSGIAMLKAIWARQGGKCALTGETLIPGHNASLDHIVAQSQGGLTVESNLQWTTFAVNRAKQDLPLADFLKLCLQVVDHLRLRGIS